MHFNCSPRVQKWFINSSLFNLIKPLKCPHTVRGGLEQATAFSYVCLLLISTSSSWHLVYYKCTKSMKESIHRPGWTSCLAAKSSIWLLLMSDMVTCHRHHLTFRVHIWHISVQRCCLRHSCTHTVKASMVTKTGSCASDQQGCCSTVILQQMM